MAEKFSEIRENGGKESKKRCINNVLNNDRDSEDPSQDSGASAEEISEINSQNGLKITDVADANKMINNKNGAENPAYINNEESVKLENSYGCIKELRSREEVEKRGTNFQRDFKRRSSDECIRRKMLRRQSPELSRSQYSLVSCGDLTPGAVRLWAALPDEVKFDPALAPYRLYYEKEHGKVENILKKKGSLPKIKPRLPLVCSAPHLNNNLQLNSVSEEQDGVEFQNGGRKHGGLEMSNIDTGDGALEHEAPKKKSMLEQALHLSKITILVLCWVFFTVIFMMYNEKENVFMNTSIAPGEVKSYLFNINSDHLSVLVKLTGPFLSQQAQENLNQSEVDMRQVMFVWLERQGGKTERNYSDDHEIAPFWKILLTDNLDFNKGELRSNVLKLGPFDDPSDFALKFNTTTNEPTPFTLNYSLDPLDMKTGVIYSSLLLLALYGLIIFEIINRTMAAVLLSTTALAVLCMVGERPSLPELVSWLDVETLLLLFSMMILVAVMAETGLFDYLAVFTFQVTKGKLWPLINLLSITTALLSTFLDNVTTVLLMTPVSIRLCEVMELDPVPVLMSMVLFSNIGGTATPVGDPPNVIIASNKAIIQAGINFTTFTLHMSVGIIFVLLQTYLQLRFIYRDTSKIRVDVPKDVREFRQQMSIWRRAADSLHDLSQDEYAVKERIEKKIRKMSTKLRLLERESNKRACPKDTFHSTLAELKEKYNIRDKVLLIKASVVTMFVVAVFFLHSIPEFNRVSLSWTALLGALLLLILADRSDLEPILHKVEWSTLLFFAALFVFMEALSKLGFIEFIGGLTESLVMKVDEKSRLAVAILILLWVSGIVSAFVDNIPLTTMMVRIVTSLGTNPSVNLPLAPLVWALSFGACLGGNGTLIGASANVVCAGVAEQHGYKFSFIRFFKVGCPVMIGHLIVSSCYLLICHCVFEWH